MVAAGELQPTSSGPAEHRAVLESVEAAQKRGVAWTKSHRHRVLVVGDWTFVPSGAEAQRESTAPTFASRIAAFGIFGGLGALFFALQMSDAGVAIWGGATLAGVVLLGVGALAATAVARADRRRTPPDVVHAGIYLGPSGILVRHAGELDDHHRFVPRDDVRDVSLHRGNRGRTSTVVEHQAPDGTKRATSLGAQDLVALVRAWLDRT